MVTYGAWPSPPDRRDYYIARITQVNKAFPRNWLPKIVPPVYDQQEVHACVAFSLKALREMQEYYERNAKQKLSAGFIYANRLTEDYQGEGMYTREALQQMRKDGVCFYSMMPYMEEYPDIKKYLTPEMFVNAQPRKIAAYARADSVEETLSAIQTLQGVIFVVPIYESFQNNKDGIIEKPQGGNILGYHAILVYGWEGYSDQEKFYYLGQNSWGLEWGKKGRFKLASDYPVTERWAVTDAPTQVVHAYYKLKLNSKKMMDSETGLETTIPAPIMYRGRMMVPLRAIGEELGLNIKWLKDEKAVLIDKIIKS